MAVTDEQAVKLFNEFVEVCIMVIKDAHVFIGTHDLKRSPLLMDKYPALDNAYFFDEKYFDEEYREKIPFLKYKIPKYENQKNSPHPFYNYNYEEQSYVLHKQQSNLL